ncbi:MAG: chaperone modulator CbpM [Treponemataceae bacterium]
MSTQNQIALIEVCDYFHIDFEIVQDFADFGLYPTVLCEGEKGIEVQYLDRVKKIISLYKTLGINKEGIEVILNLQEKISGLQDEVDSLQNKVESLKRQLGINEPETLKRLGLLVEIDY